MCGDGPLTHRQFLVLREWELVDINTPDRTAYYLMQAAAVSLSPHLNKAGRRSLSPDQFRVEIVRSAPEAEEEEQVDPAVALEITKAKWMGMGVGVYTPPPAVRTDPWADDDTDEE